MSGCNRITAKLRLFLAGSFLVALVGCSGNDDSADRLSEYIALHQVKNSICTDWNVFTKEMIRGLVAESKIRPMFKSFYERAKMSQNPALEDATTALLAAVTPFSESEYTVAIDKMYNVC